MAFRGASRSPSGGGRWAMIASSVSTMPSPVLAETGMAPEASMPITSSICSAVRDRSEAGRSILLSTGTVRDWRRWPDRHWPASVPRRLACVHHKQRPLDRAHRARDLVGEIDMAGRVDQVEHVLLAVARGVVDAHGVGLDGDAALALDIHGVEHLFLHVAFGHRIRHLDQTIGKRGFAVVDMRHDREIADMRKWCHDRGIWPGLGGWSRWHVPPGSPGRGGMPAWPIGR